MSSGSSSSRSRKELADLHDRGALSDSEFEIEKQKLLRSS